MHNIRALRELKGGLPLNHHLPSWRCRRKRLDTSEKKLGVLFNETVNDVTNVPRNKNHIPDSCTLTMWEETESRHQLDSILERIRGSETEYLEYLDK